MPINQTKGITLIELLVVIVIVGILAAIAIPGYNGYLQRARRSDAKVALEQLRAAQEMFRAERGRYANTVDDAPNDPLIILQNSWGVPVTAGDYDVIFNVSSGTAFTAEAVPNSARQASDGSLFIDQNGTKTPADKWAK